MTSSATASIKLSVRALLQSAIDYAGTYPPARLPLETAWSNYVNYRHVPQAWMLSHFVVSAGDLPKLAAFAAANPFQGEPVTVAVVGRPAATAAKWLSQWSEDLAAMRDFVPRAAGRGFVAAIEAKLPDEVIALASSAATADFVSQALSPLPENSLNAVATYFEAASLSTPATIEAQLAGIASVTCHRPSLLGFKLRSGGLEAEMFPTVEQLAVVIDACRRHRLPWKATAGLHHPIRKHYAEINAPMHGFVNLLAATALAAVHQLPIERLVQILAEQSAEQFRFDEARLSWGGLSASVAQIRSARSDGLISFGSCSFEEPCDDLRALGWLPS